MDSALLLQARRKRTITIIASAALFLTAFTTGLILFVGRGSTPIVNPGASVSPAPKPQSPSFTPSLNPAEQKGPIVSRYSVFYTLVGKVTDISPAKVSGTYTITVQSRDGAQSYIISDIGGEHILRSTVQNKDLAWEQLKKGDDVLVDVTVSPVGDNAEGIKVSVGQIAVSNR